MDEFTRYAVYAAPAPGPLADFCARWLGWDAVAGEARPHPEVPGLPAPVEQITRTPRKYGFHGTLKPPFRLAEGSDRARLEADLAALAGELPAVELEGVGLARLGGFLALVPLGDARPLARVAAEVVSQLDHHRAPASDPEREMRRAGGLTPAQETNLRRWGYPYVMDEFRFHMTLTGPLAGADATSVATALAPVLEALLPRPFRVADLCLFGEGAGGRFHLLHRYALTG